jgi:hypothetical protein
MTGTVTGIRKADTTTARFRIIIRIKLNNSRPQNPGPVVFRYAENAKRGADGSPLCFAVSSQKVRCKA